MSIAYSKNENSHGAELTSYVRTCSSNTLEYVDMLQQQLALIFAALRQQQQLSLVLLACELFISLAAVSTDGRTTARKRRREASMDSSEEGRNYGRNFSSLPSTSFDLLLFVVFPSTSSCDMNLMGTTPFSFFK